MIANTLRCGLVNRVADYPHWDAVWLIGVGEAYASPTPIRDFVVGAEPSRRWRRLGIGAPPTIEAELWHVRRGGRSHPSVCGLSRGRLLSMQLAQLPVGQPLEVTSDHAISRQ